MRGAALFLVVLGLLQMAADVAGLQKVRGLMSATLVSPAPKVFSAVRGLETFSTRFLIEWTGHDGEIHQLELTPDVYSGLRGPYNRRNAFGAVVAYGPVLATDPATSEMFTLVSRYALCGDAPLLRELGIDPQQIAGNARIRLEPVAGSELGGLPTLLHAPCR